MRPSENALWPDASLSDFSFGLSLMALSNTETAICRGLVEFSSSALLASCQALHKLERKLASLFSWADSDKVEVSWNPSDARPNFSKLL